MLKSIAHGLVAAALFGIPLALSSHSPVLDITLGTALTWLYHWLVGKYSSQTQA